jgi:hypothetical protein
LEEGDAALGGWEVWVELVVDVFAGVDVGDGRFGGCWVCGDVNFVFWRVPMSALVVLVKVGSTGAAVVRGILTIMITPLMLFASASSPAFFQ